MLQESIEWFSTSFSDANIGIAVVSLDHSIIEANSTFCNMLGYSTDQIAGISLNEITHPDDVSISRDYHQKLIAGEIDNYYFEKRYLHKQGPDIWTLLNVSLVRDVKSTPLYAIAQIQDITEFKWVNNKLRSSEQKYRTIFETSNVGMAMCKMDGTLIECNQAYLDIIGYTEEEALKLTYWEITPPEFEEQEADQLLLMEKTGQYGPYEKEYRRKDGSRIPVLLHGTLIEEFDGNEYIWSIIQDISKSKQAEEEVHKLSRAVESSSSVVFITNLDGDIEYINPRFTEVTGYTKEDAIGQTPRILKSGETPKEIFEDMWETITNGREWKGEVHNRRKDGTFYWGRVSISGIKDSQEKITHFVGIQEDVTYEHELSEQLSYQASHDILTGLINRRAFERRVGRLLSTARQDRDEHAICFMDLDQFKVVNDIGGHRAGDEMLCQLSLVLKSLVRHRDTLARLGSDEFGVLMEHCSLDDAYRVATSLQKAIQDYQFLWEGHKLKVGVSIGLVPITAVTTNLTELMKQADSACQMSKDKGRNRIHVYHEGDKELAQRHGEMQWVARINQALEEDRFCLYAQSIVPLNDSTEKHYEFLIRMKEENGKTILPGAFLPAAERYSLISKIDHWVIKKAFGLLADNPEFLEQVDFCSVNLSGQSITENNFLEFIIFQLDKSGIPGEKICFEITETAAITNLNLAVKLIKTLKGLKCRFALDDFGSGLSSFAYLKNLPVDNLKIDGMFVKNIVYSPIDHAMVKSINEIGQVMGMKTIAEFVENDEIKNMLREIGVDYGQGYGIDQPHPLDELVGKSN